MKSTKQQRQNHGLVRDSQFGQSHGAGAFARTSRLRFESLESRVLLAIDFGDAPMWYPTTLAEDGARHADIDDEDGVAFGAFRAGQLGASVTVHVQNALAGATLDPSSGVFGARTSIKWSEGGFDSVVAVDIDGDSDMDFGDAPSPYPTTLAENGARHAPLGPRLGPGRDVELDGTHSVLAEADNITGFNDEDGVTFLSPMIGSAQATAASVAIDLQNADPAANRLDAWIDFNADGDWTDAGEQIAASVELGTADGVQVVAFDIPAGATPGNTYARFRVSTVGGLSPTGAADDGEVEDYLVEILDGHSPQNVVVDMVGGGEFQVVRCGDALKLTHGAATIFQAPLAAIDRLTLNGSDADDHLTADFSGGAPIPGNGMWFHAQTGSDSLALEMGTWPVPLDTVRHGFAAAQDGRVEVDLDGGGPGSPLVLQYTGLEPVRDNLDATRREFVYSGGVETVTLADVPGPGSILSSTLGESVVFANPRESLTIDSPTGADTIRLQSIDTAGPFNANLFVYASWYNSIVDFDSAVLDVGAGSVKVRAGTIAFSAGGIRTSGDVWLMASDTGQGITANASGVDVAAASLALTAFGGDIGENSPLRTSVGSLSAVTTGGTGVSIFETDAITLTYVSGEGGSVAVNAAGSIIAEYVSLVERNITLTTRASGHIFAGYVCTDDGQVTLQSAWGVLEYGNDPDPDVIATKLVARATTAIGMPTQALETKVDKLEAITGKSGITLVNAGALTIGGISSVCGVWATDGEIALTAAGSITINENVVAGKNLTITAGGTAAAGDNLTLAAGAKITATGGAISLRAGDKLDLRGGSTVSASGCVSLDLGYGDTDAVSEGSVAGTIQTSTQVLVRGSAGRDTLKVNLASAVLPVAGVKFDGGGERDSLVVLGRATAEVYCVQDTTPKPSVWAGNQGTIRNTTTVVPANSSTPAPARGPVIDYVGLEILQIDTLAGTDDVTFQMAANTPFLFKVDGGDAPSGASDGVRILGTADGDQIGVAGFDAPCYVDVSYYLYNPVTKQHELKTVSIAQRFQVRNVELLQVFSLGGIDSVVANAGIPSLLSGGDGNDFLWGGSLRDAIFGGRGRDQLFGGGGDDYLLSDHDYTPDGTLVALTPAEASSQEYLDGDDGSDAAVQSGTDYLFDIERVNQPGIVDEVMALGLVVPFPKCPL